MFKTFVFTFFLLGCLSEISAFTQIINNPGIVQEMDGTYNVDVIINSDNYVLIKNKTIYFTAGKRIIVKAGGVLVIKNSILTLATDNSGATSLNLTDFWGGIQVGGVNNRNQDYEFNTIFCSGKLNCIDTAGTNVHRNLEDHLQCFGPMPNQGMVYIANSKLKYMVVGFRVGDVNNSVNTMLVTKKPQQSTTWQSGGIVIALNTKFQNFANAAFTFAPYTSFYQQSVIKSCSTEVDFRSTVSVQKLRGAWSVSNCFKLPIESNVFSTLTTNVNPTLYCGLDLFQSNLICIGNKFVNTVGYGINCESFYPSIKRRNEFTGNYFYNNPTALRVVGSDQTLVNSNTVFMQASSTYGQGIACWDGGNYSIENNICKLITNRSNNIWASIMVTLHGKLPANVSYNKIYGTKELLRFQDDNKYSIFRCNSFYSTIFTEYEVADAYPNGQGHGNQGAASKPATNIFNQTLNPSKQLNIVGGAYANVFSYFYNNAVASYKPRIVDAHCSPYKIFVSNPSCVYPILDKSMPSDPCGRPIWNYGGGISSYKNGLLGTYSSLNNAFNPNTSDYEYVESLVDYDNSLISIISLFQDIASEDSISFEEYKDSILFYVLNHKSDAKYYYGIPYLIELGRNSEASDLIDSFIYNNSDDTSVSEICSYYTLLNEYQNTGYSDTWALNHFDILYALSQHYGISRGKAATFATYAASIDSTHQYFGAEIYKDSVYILSSETEEDDSVLVTASPVPFDTELEVHIINNSTLDFIGTVSLYNLNMDFIETVNVVINHEASEDYLINTTPYETGFYVVVLMDHNSMPLNQFIVYKY